MKKIKNFADLQNCNISKFNQYIKSDKTLFAIYADLESFIKKIDGRVNNPEKSSTTEKGEHVLCRCSMLTEQKR